MIQLKVKSRVFLPAFRPYISDYTNRYEIYWGGRASGKTVFIIQKLLLKGIKEKRFILLMNKQTAGIKDKVWKELLDAISFFHLEEYFTLNRSEFRATCVNGTEFRCLGLDEPEKAKAISNVSDIYLDELNQFTQDDYELLDGSLRSKRYQLPLQLIGSFNPVSKQNWVYRYFGFDKGITPPNTFIHHSTYKDNPYCDASYIERMEQMKRRNPTRYRIEAEGQFATLDKLVYTNWDVREFNPEEYRNLPLLVGLDFGFSNDPTALVASMIDEENKCIYIFKEWVATGKTNDEIARAIISLGFSKSVIIADSAENKSIEELRRNGIMRVRASVKGPDSIRFGIMKLQEYEFIVHPDCQNVITELENYSWQKDRTTGEYIDKPIDAFNHCLDAFRYSLQCVSSPKLKTISKSMLGI